MENWISDIILRWKSEGVKLNPPATIGDIENTEAILDFKFPADFQEFYLQANGFESFYMQAHLFTLWPLEVIIEEFQSEHLSDENFVGICDYLIASHSIGFSKRYPGIFKHYNHTDKESIAETFKDLVEMINLGDKGVY